MKNALFLMIAFLIANQLKAEDTLGKLYALSEDVREVVLKSPGGHPMPNREFQLTTVQADQMQALASLDDSMRTHLENSKNNRDCDQYSLISSNEKKEKLHLEKRVNNRGFQIEAVVFSSDKKFEQNSLGRFMSNDYINYMGQIYLKGNLKSAAIYSIDSLMNKYKADHPGNNLDSLKFADKEKVLNEFAENFLGTKLPSGLLMKEMAFQNMVNNSANWKETLLAAKDKLSTAQKIELVSKFGGSFGNLYNYERFEAGSKVNGEFINMEQLLNSVKNGVPGGVCRDIALAQTQMLKELGFTHNYAVAYKTLSGSHVSAMTTDPATGKIIKFNYSEAYESKKGSGTEALIQDSTLPDHGLSFRIFDSNGKPVTHVPSELSQMLRETAGASSERDFTPRNFSLTNVGFKSSYVDGSLFTGKTSTGETLYGVALYKNMSVNEYLSGGVGTSLSKIEGNRSLVKMDQDNLYLNMHAELTSPSLKLGATETKAFLGGSAEALSSNNKETTLATNRSVEAKNEHDGSADFYAGIQNSIKSTNGNTTVDSKIYASFYPESNHVASVDKTIAVIDSIVVKSGVSHQITDDTRALIDTAVVMKNYGTSIVIKAEMADSLRGSRYIAGVSTPITKDMPTFLPGGERRAFGGFEKGTEKMMFSIMYERNFDNNSKNLMLKGEVKF